MLMRMMALLGAPAVVALAASAAWSAELSKDYLAGTWGVGGPDACGRATSEQITFRPDGTFSSERAGQPTAVGFWHLVQDNLDLHMISSPAFFDDPTTKLDDALQAYAGQYGYFYAKALLFDVNDHDFRMVASLGDMLRGANLARCQKSG
jgi:hypothetical protein